MQYTINVTVKQGVSIHDRNPAKCTVTAVCNSGDKNVVDSIESVEQDIALLVQAAKNAIKEDNIYLQRGKS